MALKRFISKDMLHRKARILVFGTVLLAVLGPFGTYDSFGFSGRFTYWAVLLIACGVIFHISIEACLSSQKLTRLLSRWQRFLLGVLGGAVVGVWVAVIVETFTRGMPALTTIPWIFVCVAIIGLAIGFVNFMPPFVQLATFQEAMDIDFDRIQFYREHSNLKGSKVRWITMEDHYARVVLDNKDVSLHASMKELEEQLQFYPGLRVHRSHWVAYESMLDVIRTGRSSAIKVDEKTKLPIGGKYQKSVERVFAELRRPSR